MDHSFAVRRIQTVGHLRADVDDLFLRQRTGRDPRALRREERSVRTEQLTPSTLLERRFIDSYRIGVGNARCWRHPSGVGELLSRVAI